MWRALVGPEGVHERTAVVLAAGRKLASPLRM
jgi:hypothetical protein